MLGFERFQDVLPVLNITEQTVLVQAVYVKRSAGVIYTFPIAINMPTITIAHWQIIRHIISFYKSTIFEARIAEFCKEKKIFYQLCNSKNEITC